MKHGLKFLAQAAIPIAAIAVIVLYFLTQHGEAIARSHEALHAAKGACVAAHDIGTSILNGVKKLSPGPKTQAALTKLQAGVDKTYHHCLAGVKR